MPLFSYFPNSILSRQRTYRDLCFRLSFALRVGCDEFIVPIVLRIRIENVEGDEAELE